MLSLSCPEAARLILEDETQGMWKEKKRPAVFWEQQTAVRKNWPKPELLEDLEELRRTMVCLIKDRSVDWRQRQAMLLALAHDFQRHWNKIREAGYPYSRQRRRQWGKRLSKRYLAREAAGRFARRLEHLQGAGKEQRIRIAAWMRLMQRMEPVLFGWEQKAARMCSSLYHQRSAAEYQLLCLDFDEAAAGLEQEWENLMLYFVNTYVLGAVYDGDVYTKVKLAVFGTRIIREWCLFRYGTSGKINREELAGAAYRYSREVENCDENLDLLEEELGQNPLFGLEEMLKGI
jgi:lysine-N-methylase